MTKEEAIKNLLSVKEGYRDYLTQWLDVFCKHGGLKPLTDWEDAIDLAIAALREPSGWVKTADRLPTDEDGNTHMVLCGCLVPPLNGEKAFYVYEIAAKHAVCQYPEYHPLWMPLPPLPESVGLEGTKTEGDA